MVLLWNLLYSLPSPSPANFEPLQSADVNTHDQIHALFANYTWVQV
jgi:hypothetical protein